MAKVWVLLGVALFMGFPNIAVYAQGEGGDAGSLGDLSLSPLKVGKNTSIDRPDEQLLIAYTYYYRINECYKARDGYATVYINKQELDDAKKMAMEMEKKLKPQLTKKVNEIWNQATKSTLEYMYIGKPELKAIDTGYPFGVKSLDYQSGLFICRNSRNDFLKQSSFVLGDLPVEKPF